MLISTVSYPPDVILNLIIRPQLAESVGNFMERKANALVFEFVLRASNEDSTTTFQPAVTQFTALQFFVLTISDGRKASMLIRKRMKGIV